jgi:hypothetical protein
LSLSEKKLEKWVEKWRGLFIDLTQHCSRFRIFTHLQNGLNCYGDVSFVSRRREDVNGFCKKFCRNFCIFLLWGGQIRVRGGVVCWAADSEGQRRMADGLFWGKMGEGGRGCAMARKNAQYGTMTRNFFEKNNLTVLLRVAFCGGLVGHHTRRAPRARRKGW